MNNQLTPDQRMNVNVLKRIMREQDVSLLEASQQLYSNVNEAVDFIREEYLRDHNITAEQLANS